MEIPSWASLNGSFGNGSQGCHCAVAVSVVHGVCARRKGLSGLSAVRGGAGIISVHHVGGDGEDGSGGDTAAVGVVALYIAHEGVHQVCCQLVYPVVVISIFREVAFDNIISHNALIVAHRLDPGILDGGQGVCNNGEACNAGCEPAGHLFVVERHLQSFIAVFVVHVMDDVQGVDIYLGQPFHHILVLVHHLVIIQILGGDRDGI